MILDRLSHCSSSAALHPLFPAAFDYLQRFAPSTPDGKYELEGNRLYAMVQRYETAPEETRKWESHRLYADIQFVVSGSERMLYTPVEELCPLVPYNETKDVEKFADEGVRDVTPVLVSAGSFCIFLPQDGHKPGCLVDRPEPVVKVVIKIRL